MQRFSEAFGFTENGRRICRAEYNQTSLPMTMMTMMKKKKTNKQCKQCHDVRENLNNEGFVLFSKNC
jgi:hypothetical protein